MSSSKERGSSEIIEIEQNDVTNDVLHQKRDMVPKNTLSDYSSNCVDQLYFSWLFRKNQVELFKKAMK